MSARLSAHASQIRHVRRRTCCAAAVALTAVLATPAVGAAPSTGAGAGPVVRRMSFPATVGGATEAAIAVDPRDARRIAVLATDYTGYVVAVPGAGQEARVAPTC